MGRFYKSVSYRKGLRVPPLKKEVWYVSIFPISERIVEELIPITSDFTARTDDIWVDFFMKI